MRLPTLDDAEPAAPDVVRAQPDRCPGVLALHEAADGALARVRLPGGRLTSAQLRAVAAAAQELGNGLVDVTSRANLQVRGLRADGAEEIASRFDAAGLLPSRAHDRVRNVLASPLAGRARLACDEVDDVVVLLDERLRRADALARLPGRFCFLVDDGSGIGAEARPDVTVIARGGGRFGVLVDGSALVYEGEAGAAVELALGAADAFLGLADDAWRVREMPGGAAAVAEQLGLPVAGERHGPAGGPLVPGISSQRDHRSAVTVLAPLGQLGPQELRALARAGEDARLSQQRTITIVDVPADFASGVLDELRAAGLVTQPDSGWTGLTACAGTGRCPSALGDVRHAAAA
ncbi:MAG: hypothetical protein ACRDKY_06635, partial [Solirubrobacteraceae bacterium]